MRRSLLNSAFILSGGGAKGAYQVGVCRKLIEGGVIPSFITGVSTGALTGAMLCQYGAEVGIQRLWDLYEGIESYKDIYSKPKWWKVIFGQGLYSNKPLEKLLDKHLSNRGLYDSDIVTRFGVVNMQTGEYEGIVNKDMRQLDNLKKFILASTSYSPAFAPVTIGNAQYTDGGTRNVVPPGQSLGSFDKIYVVLCSPLVNKVVNRPFVHMIDIGLRNISIMINEIYKNDIYYLKEEYGDKVVVIEPKEEYMGSLDFDHDKIMNAMNRGYEDGESAL